jgi:hypothetical protein
VHLTGGILRNFQAFSAPKQNPASKPFSTPARQQVTHTVGRFAGKWEKYKMKFEKRLSLTLAFVLFLPSCSVGGANDHESISQIYAKTIVYDFQHEWMGTKTYCSDNEINISDQTHTEVTNGETFKKDDWKWASRNLSQLQENTWDNFLTTNSQSIPFPKDLNLGCPYTLVDTKADQPAESFENCISTYYLSQIGFNNNKNQAIVYLTKTCGDYAHGNLYLLELQDNQWSISHMEEIFIT